MGEVCGRRRETDNVVCLALILIFRLIKMPVTTSNWLLDTTSPQFILGPASLLLVSQASHIFLYSGNKLKMGDPWTTMGMGLITFTLFHVPCHMTQVQGESCISSHVHRIATSGIA